MSKDSLSTPEKRGKRAEERFFKAWSDPRNFAKWMVAIDRPTKHEDLFQKTDAVIIGISGPILRIQIKAYRLYPEECATLMEYGVIPLSLSSKDTLVRIRKKTFKALRLFKEFNIEKTFTKKSLSLSNTKTVWYKKRKRKHV